jgi:hypothetical protein
MKLKNISMTSSLARRVNILFVAVSFIGSSALVGCSSGDGIERHHLSGVVTVDGNPADRMIVQLTQQGASVDDRERYVSSHSNADGEFAFGDFADGTPSRFPALPAGEYAVTFSWLSSDGLDAIDRLNGKFADANSTRYRVTVPFDSSAAPLRFELITKR